MKLLGQFDSPFVRRVAIALRLYEIPFEHVPWSVWGNAEQIAQLNPLRRVPTLVLDDGQVLLETFAILDALDERVGAERALIARSGPLRQRALRLVSLASGFTDKAVSMLYETLFREAPSERWVERCRTQVHDTLAVLEAERAASAGHYFLGDSIGHADIAVACGFRFLNEAHPGLVTSGMFPGLTELCARCDALPAFSESYQPISNRL